MRPIPAPPPRTNALGTLLLLVMASTAGEAAAQPMAVVDGASRFGVTVGTRDRPTLTDPVHYWFQRGRCQGSGEFPGLPDAPPRIWRIPALGGFERRLVEVAQPPGACSPDVYRLYSNLAVDGDHLYFFDAGEPPIVVRLRRILRSASPESVAYQALDSFLGFEQSTALVPHEVTIGGPHVFYVFKTTSNRTLYRRSKDPAVFDRIQVATSTAVDIGNLQWDGRYLWFLKGGELWRHDPNGNALRLIASGVTAYHADFYDEDPHTGQRTNQAQYAKGREMWWVDAETSTHDLEYTSPDATAIIYDIERDASRYFFFESRSIGSVFGERRHLLYRRPVGRAASAALLHDFGVLPIPLESLHGDYVHLYWVDPVTRSLYRLLGDSAAVPTVNLRAVGLEVVQSIQNGRGDVPLVAGKRTFVRFRVQSDGADVPDVTARLTVTQDGVSYPLQPSIGASVLPDAGLAGVPTPRITVKSQPSRWSLADSFTFELPRHLTTGPPIALTATVNPGLAKPEPGAAPLADNSITRSPVTFEFSPRINLGLVLIDYRLGGTLHRAAQEDVDASVAYLRRTWPLDSSTGDLSVGGSGLRVRQLRFRDDAIATRVARTDAECLQLPIDDRNLCAGQYAQAVANGLQARGLLPAFPFVAYRYVMIPQTQVAQCAPLPDGTLPCFTRGFASGVCQPGNRGGSGVGPIGPGTNEVLLTYLAHEAGHMVARGHPAEGNSCGHSEGDPAFPYQFAWIGEAGSEDAQFYALDPGDARISAPFSLYRYYERRDLMSYCAGQWISDYTFRGILSCFGGGGVALGRSGSTSSPAPMSGDWLMAYGWVAPESAALTEVRRVSEVVSLPATTSGPHALRLIGTGGDVLASHAFASEPIPDSRAGVESFGLIVPYAAGTRELRVVRLATGEVLGSRAVSPSRPVVSNVRLVGAVEPVSGTIALAWDASDPDGDPLRFDVLYSDDAGLGFEPVRLGVAERSLAIDTGSLGGGTARFRVVANDGVQSAQADSPDFAMAGKAPAPRILLPAPGASFAWGQLVLLQGEATDPQDGGVEPDGLEWSNQYGPLGTGAELALDDLPVGANTFTLTATNSAGLVGTTSITIAIADELGATAPTLSVSPLSIHLHAAAGASEPEGAEIRITNAGGGSLAFSVATDGAPWLSLPSAASGAAPATLAVLADPTGLEPGLTHTANVTITPNGRLQEARTIAVSISIGNVHETGGGLPEPSGGALAVVAVAALAALARRRARTVRRSAGP